MYRSHARNAFERFMKIFSPTLVLYRCHQCNWRGYMFRRFKSQSRFAFWMTLLGIVLGGIAGVVGGWFVLVQIVGLLLGR
jgi:Tfp pilus assembly protein PilN